MSGEDDLGCELVGLRGFGGRSRRLLGDDVSRVVVVLGNRVCERLLRRCRLRLRSNVCVIVDVQVSGKEGREILLRRHRGQDCRRWQEAVLWNVSLLNRSRECSIPCCEVLGGDQV